MNGKTAVPFIYQYALASVIFKKVTSADQSYADFSHKKGYAVKYQLITIGAKGLKHGGAAKNKSFLCKNYFSPYSSASASVISRSLASTISHLKSTAGLCLAKRSI